jgi:hypothetical protein
VKLITRNNFRYLSVDRQLILNRILNKEAVKVLMGFNCLKVGTSGGLL